MLSVCLHSLCNFYLFYEILDFAFLKLCKRDLITIREETLSLIFDFFFVMFTECKSKKHYVHLAKYMF